MINQFTDFLTVPLLQDFSETMVIYIPHRIVNLQVKNMKYIHTLYFAMYSIHFFCPKF